MTTDIFKLFKNSIEQVQIKNTDRAAINKPQPDIQVTIDAIVKRRKSMATAIENSEDYNNNTTIHFRQSDVQYVKVGYYVNIDDEWHTIKEVKDGKDFDQGISKFPYATIDNDIVPSEEDPVWQ